ncbi:permease prefix domain 1-containing protein [Bacillus timonensis]|nr:permease prefix domain 1-containing protein [Bacillus timonensis]
MKQIDEFVNSIYAHVSGKEAKELKQEMRSHLVETVEELKAEGNTEKEAISIAIERFGDERQITKGLFDFFKIQNKVVKTLNISALICLLIGISYFLVGNTLFDNHQKANNVLNQISDIIGDDEISESEKEKINSTIKEGDFEYFALFEQPDPDLEFDSEFRNKWTKVMTYGYKYTRDEISVSGILGGEETWFFEIGYKTYPLLTSFAVPVSFLVLSLIICIISFFLKQSFQRKVMYRLLLS